MHIFVLMIVVEHSSCTQLKKEIDKSKHNSSFLNTMAFFSFFLILRRWCFFSACFVFVFVVRAPFAHCCVQSSYCLFRSLSRAHTQSQAHLFHALGRINRYHGMQTTHVRGHTHTHLLRAQSQRTHNVVIVVMLKFCVYKNTLLLV